ncbi:MAG: glycosyltransferase [Acidobacteria bacterium]|nr:glycosyltransferase [Acidobacteriota bacterium]
MPSIALVHDYFIQMGGAERVAEALHQIFPAAPLYTTVALPHRLTPSLRQAAIHTSFMQRMPAIESKFRQYFMLYPWAVESLDLSAYDLILSSSSGYGKGVHRSKNAIHVCYCHTPMRWVWRYDDYAAREGFGTLSRVALPAMLSGLRWWDRRASRQPDYYIANSSVVAERIRQVYQREAVVIPPPIEVDRFQPSTDVEEYFLVLSRLVPYKRIDLAVEACTKMKKELIVIGDGPDRPRLERMAGKTVRFLGRQPDAVVNRFASRCRALLFPGEEDFGMVPLEINAAGRPVIAYRAGGALETVVEGITGLFFNQPTSESLAKAIESFEKCQWSSGQLRHHAEQFSYPIFANRILTFLAQVAPQSCQPELSALGQSLCKLNKTREAVEFLAAS